MEHTPKDPKEYRSINDTELVELCKMAGLLSAHRGLGRETLIGLLTGKVDEDDCKSDPIDDDRDLMQYLMSNYPEQIYSQLGCADEKYFCPHCPTGRTVACAVIRMSPALREDSLKELHAEQVARQRANER